MSAEAKHGGCFVCGEGDGQSLLQSKTIFKITTLKGDVSPVPRSIAVCKGCESVTEVDLRQTSGK